MPSPHRFPRRPLLLNELEARDVPSAATQLIGLDQLRTDSRFAGLDGSGTSVVVIDTGTDFTHPLLAGAFRYAQDFSVLNKGTDKSFVTGTHGTHVAGIVGARNKDIGIAPDVGLIGLNVFQPINGSVLAPNANTEKALRWVLDNRAKYNIVAVNMSLGSGGFTAAGSQANSVLEDEIRGLEAAGVTVVSAAGNNYVDNNATKSAVGIMSSPGIRSTIGVGAVWQDTNGGKGANWASGAKDITAGPDRLTSFSNRLQVGTTNRGATDLRASPAVSNTLFAPGAVITSTLPGNKTGSMAGTSQASPIVAGGVAVVQEAASKFLGRQLSSFEVRDVLFRTADLINDGDDENDNVRNTGFNFPRLNLFRAVEDIYNRRTNNPNPPAPPPSIGDINGTLATAVPVNFAGTQATDGGKIGFDGNNRSDSTTAGDVDMYRVVLTAPTSLRVNITSNLDPVFRLFNSTGTQIAFNDDSIGLQPALNVRLDAGTYFVGVSGYNNVLYDPTVSGSGKTRGSTGDYTITFGQDNADPNGTRAGAIPVSLQYGNGQYFFDINERIDTDYKAGVTTFPNAVAVGSADVDFFRYTATSDGKMNLRVRAGGSIKSAGQLQTSGLLEDSYLRVYGTDGKVLAFNDDISLANNWDSEIIGLPVTAGQTYYIGVSSYTNNSYNPDDLTGRNAQSRQTGRYGLEVGFSPVIVAGGKSDLNGTIKTAAVADWSQIAGGTFVNRPGNLGYDLDGPTGTKTVSGEYDVDFIRLDVPAGSKRAVEFRVNSYTGAPAGAITTPVDGTLRLFDSNGNSLSFVDDTQTKSGYSLDPSFQYTLAGGQTYYLAVAGYGNSTYDPYIPGSGSPGDTGDYLLSIRSSAPEQTISRDDNKRGNSGVLALAPGVPVSRFIGSDTVLSEDGSTEVSREPQDIQGNGLSDVDQYTFTSPTAGVFDVRVTSVEAIDASIGDGRVRVFDPAGAEVPSAYIAPGRAQGSVVRFRAEANQTYSVVVVGATSKLATAPINLNDPSVLEEDDASGILSAGGYDLVVNNVGTGLDVDGDGRRTDNDAIIISRFLGGIEPELLTADLAIPAGAARTTGADLASYLTQQRDLLLDADGNGFGNSDNDAIMISRFLGGIETELLTTDLDLSDVTVNRAAGADVASYLALPGGDAPGGDTPGAAGEDPAAPLAASRQSVGLAVPDGVQAGQPFAVTVNYSTDPAGEDTTSVTVRLAYNSSRLTFVNATDVLAFGKNLAPTVTADTNNVDGDPSTDKVVVARWQEARWPGFGSGTSSPAVLFRANFTPAADFAVGQTTPLNAVVSPATGVAAGDPARVTVRGGVIPPVTNNPIAAPDVATTAFQTSVLLDVLANDRDPDGTPLVLTGVSDVVGGTAVVENGRVRFTPAAGFTGLAGFRYGIVDGNGGSAVGQATVTVLPGTVIMPPPITTRPGLVGYTQFTVGGGAGGPVTLYNPDGSARFAVDPFPGFAGGVRTVTADFNGDGTPDLAVGTGPGAASRVVVYSGTDKAVLFDLAPFEAAFTGGVFLSAGDLTGDGKAELVISPDEGGGPRVRVFSGAGFGQLADFFGIDDPNFRGGARTAVADVTGDGVGDLIVAAGFGGGPRVAVFDGTSLTSGAFTRKAFGDFFAFEDTLRNGVYVAGGDVDGDGKAELIAAGGPGGGPRVSAFSGADLLRDGSQRRVADFFAGDVNNRGGVRVAVKDLDGDNKADIVTGAGAGAGSRVTGYTGRALAANGGSPDSLFGFDALPGTTAGVFVG